MDDMASVSPRGQSYRRRDETQTDPATEIIQLRKKNSYLVNCNTELERSFNVLNHKYEEAKNSMESLQETLKDRIENEEKMKGIVSQMKDYMCSADTENKQLKEENFRLKCEKDRMKVQLQEKDLKLVRLEERENAQSQTEFGQRSNGGSLQKTVYELERKLKKSKEEEDRIRNEKTELVERLSETKNSLKALEKQNAELTRQKEYVQDKYAESVKESEELMKYKNSLQLEMDRTVMYSRSNEEITRGLKLDNEKLKNELARKTEQNEVLMHKMNIIDTTWQENKFELDKSREYFKASENCSKVLEHQLQVTHEENEKAMQECRRLEIILHKKEADFLEVSKDRDGWKATAESLRIKMEDVLAKLDYHKEQNESSSEKITALKQDVKELEIQLKSAKEDLNSALEQREKLRNEVTALTVDATQLRNEKTWLKEKFEDHAKRKQTDDGIIIQLRDEISRIRSAKEGLEKEIDEKSLEVKTLANTLDSLRSETETRIHEVTSFIQNLKTDNSDLEEKVKNLERENNMLKSQTQYHSSVVEELSQLKHELQETIFGKEMTLKSASEEIRSLSEDLKCAQQDCETAKQSLSQKQRQTKQLKNELLKVTDERDTVRKQLKKSKGQLKSLDVKHKELLENNHKMSADCEKCNFEMMDYDRKLDECEKMIRELTDNNLRLENQLVDKTKLLENISENSEELEKALAKIGQNMRNLQNEKDIVVRNFRISEKKVVRLENALQKVQSELETHLKTANDLKTGNSVVKAERDKLKEKLASAEISLESSNKNVTQLKISLEAKEADLTTNMNELRDIKTKMSELISERRLLEEQLKIEGSRAKEHLKTETALLNEKKELVDELRDYKTQNDCLQQKLNETKNDNTNVMNKLKEMSEKACRLETLLEEKCKDFRCLNKSLAELRISEEKARENVADISGKLGNSSTRNNELEKSCCRIEWENKELKEVNQKLVDENQLVQNKLRSLDEERNKLTDVVKQLEHANCELSKELLTVRENYKATLTEALQWKKEARELKHKNETERNHKYECEVELKMLKNKLGSVTEKLTSCKDINQELQGAVHSKNIRSDEMTLEVRELKKKNEDLKEQVRLTDKQKKEIEQVMHAQIRHLRSCLASAEDELNMVKDLMKEGKANMERVMKELSEEKEKNTELRITCEKQESAIKSLTSKQEELTSANKVETSENQKASKRLSQLEQLLQKYKKECNNFRMMLEFSEQDVNRLKKNINDIEARNTYLEKETAQLRAYAHDLERSRADLKKRIEVHKVSADVQREKGKEIMQELKQCMNEKKALERSKHELEKKLIKASHELDEALRNNKEEAITSRRLNTSVHYQAEDMKNKIFEFQNMMKNSQQEINKFLSSLKAAGDNLPFLKQTESVLSNDNSLFKITPRSSSDSIKVHDGSQKLLNNINEFPTVQQLSGSHDLIEELDKLSTSLSDLTKFGKIDPVIFA